MVREYLRRLGSRGGTSRAQRMTPAQRSASAQRAAVVRWQAVRREQKAKEA